jgi:hypothetical protein
VAVPVSYEAEAAELAGASVVSACPTCSGGKKVRFVGGAKANSVTFGAVTAATAGSYRLTITYELDATTRTFELAVNGGTGTAVPIAGGAGWSMPASMTTTVTLKAGTNTIRLYNNTANAPDLDKITIG